VELHVGQVPLFFVLVVFVVGEQKEFVSKTFG
jgi:hypothetical protein